MIFRPTVSTLIVSFLCLVPYSAQGQEGPTKREAWREQIFTQLNLSDEQKGRLKEIKEKLDRETKSLRADRRDLYQKLHVALDSPESTDDQLRALNRQIQVARAKSDEARFENILLIREVLNAEQRKKFNSLRTDHWRKEGH